MPEDPDVSDPNSENAEGGKPPGSQRRKTGAAFAGETTGSFSDVPVGDSSSDETVLAPAGSGNEIIGDYEILGKLGQGGMGYVYRARQISLHRQVALKILPANLDADDEFVARFQREARTAASLNHENIVKVYASGLVDGCHYIAMELIEGETLAQFLKRGALEAPDALRITLDVARALQCGWNKAHLIHRDIKPGNIFLSEQGEVKVGDLGLARSMANDTTGLTQTGTAMGTPNYISPEQAKGERDLDFRADIYSLGCTLFQMLTGRTPYAGADPMSVMAQHIHGPPPAILKVFPQCPIPLARLVGKMLKKVKRERQASYEELIAEIEKAQAVYAPTESATLAAILPPDNDATMLDAPVPDSTKSRVPTAATIVLPKPRSKLPLYSGIAAAVLIFGGIAGVTLRPKKQEEKLTKAQLAMQQREAEEQTKATAAIGSTRAPDSAGVEIVESGARATKETPFINSLRMKFVPVSIGGGPTAGQRIYFSIWETRRQDYEPFIHETQRDWPTPDFAQDQTHPAVNVTWDDAQAYCAWLTERERKAGNLSSDEVYRLPRDNEWSYAAGIGGRENSARSPAVKDSRIVGAYVWGDTWPPPPDAGNFGGEAPSFFDSSQPPPLLENYRDGFARTSPVGSFQATGAGLYDLAGNVLEWCEDIVGPDGSPQRVVRGASYNDRSQQILRSSRRAIPPRDRRNPHVGFRVVRAPDLAAASASASRRLVPEPVKFWTTMETIPTTSGITFENGVLGITENALLRNAHVLFRNGTFRASVLMNPDPGESQIQVRGTRDTARKEYAYSLNITRSSGTATLVRPPNRTLATWKLPRTYRPDEWVKLELTTIDDAITASADGIALGTVLDTTLDGPGAVNLYASGKGYFRDLEFIPLDQGTIPSRSSQAAPLPDFSDWKPLFAKGVSHASTPIDPWDGLIRYGRFVEKPGGAFVLDNAFLLAPQPSADVAIRARILCKADSLFPSLVVRRIASRYYRCGLQRDRQTIALICVDATRTRGITSASLPAPLKDGEALEVELRVVGDELACLVNGRELMNAYVPDDWVIRGPSYWGLTADVNCTFEHVEGRSLASPTSANADSLIPSVSVPAGLR